MGSGNVAVIRIDAIWLSVDPMDMRAGILTAGVLAHVLVAKYKNNLPLYRQVDYSLYAGLR